MTSSPDRRALLLLFGLLAACTYACFANGAVGLPEEPRLQVVICGLAVFALVVGVGGGALRWRADRRTWLAVALLAGFGAWAALSVLWSVAPDRSWAEANRTIAYVLVVVLAIAVGTSLPRAVERLAIGVLAVVIAVAAFALGGKALPGVSVPLLFDLDNSGGVSRLRAPLDYWNALGLLVAMAAPIALRLAADAERSRRVRVVSMLALWWLLIALAMTYSRGGVLALGAAIGVLLLLADGRLRMLVTLSVALLAAGPVLAAGFTLDGVSENTADLGRRIDDGLVLTAAMVASGFVLALVWGFAVTREHLVGWTPERSRRLVRTAVVAGGVAACLVSVGVATAAEGGWRAKLDEATGAFTGSTKDETLDPARLASTNSGNRWAWWNEAAGGWSDRPVAGWGAGSFALVHKRYRVDDVAVLQPHSVPLQFLVETGIIGAGLALGALALLFAGAVGRVRAMAAGRQREVAAALVAGASGWVIHSFFDWDWDIPAVTIPMLLLLGVLCARPDGRAAGGAPDEPFPDAERDGRRSPGRVLAVAAGCVVLATATVSAALPGLADSVASDAAGQLGDDASPEDFEAAAARAQLAVRLDPLAVRPLVVSASIATGRGRLLDARRYLLRAADRAPDDPAVWIRVASIALQLADREGLRDAARRALELDPVNATARSLAARAESAAASPSASATAVGTPLPVVTAVPDLGLGDGVPVPPVGGAPPAGTAVPQDAAPAFP